MIPLAILLMSAPLARAASFVDNVRATKFLKGNVHAHSNTHADRGYDQGKGDGDSPPDEVAGFYAAKGYDFASVTDHNELTDAAAAGATVLPGIELTSHYGATKSLPVHVNALCVESEARGLATRDTGAGGVLQATINAARGAGAALVVVNHPTFDRALAKSDLLGATGYDAIEIASGHPGVQKDDAAAPESAEALWDDVLTAGTDVWGVAADDAHDFKGKVAKGEDALRPPGRAWVQVWAESKSAASLCDALKRGRFYSSTGPRLKSLSVEGDELEVVVAGPWDKAADTVEFLKARSGSGENLAQLSRTASARYRADGTEGYVRIRVTQGGKRAWTQAYRVR